MRNLYLLIGGSHDGRRMVMPGERIVDLPEFREKARNFREALAIYSIRRERSWERYRLEILNVGKEEVVSFYVLEGISGEEALSMLVQNYKGRHE